MADAGLAVVEARVVATRRGGGSGGGARSAAVDDGSCDHRNIPEADGHIVGGRWVEAHDGGGGRGGVHQHGSHQGGVVVLAGELAMTGRASNAGEAARVAAAVATPAFMSELQEFGMGRFSH
jgi:hypothetical protein